MRVFAHLRVRPLAELSGPTLLVASFAILIAIGTTGLLVLPGLYTGEPLDFVDALFTMTSAVCVTGLTVVDTATYFTFWGQLWLLTHIQLGGIGLITLTSTIMGAMGVRLSLRTEAIAVSAPLAGERVEVWRLALSVIRFMLVAEIIGAGLLFALWAPQMPMREALWHAVFHAVSAFCNAGFSTFSDSLVGWSHSAATLAVVSALIVTGGLGYLVLQETWQRWRAGVRRVPGRVSCNTYAAVATTTILLGAGAVAYAFLEWDSTLVQFDTADRVMNAWFMSVTARTAGFNTVDYSHLGNDAAFVTVMLMLIGGAPGSTAGGIKTTTLAVLVALAFSRLRGRRFVAIHDRGIPRGTIERAVSLSLLAATVLTAAVLMLNFLHGTGVHPHAERAQFLPMVFEAVSAFATVGLSMGSTGRLGDEGHLVTIALMFVGRVGLYSFFAAVALRRPRRARGVARPAEEDLFVG